MGSSLIARTNHYVYQPLLCDRKQIRLIHLPNISNQSSQPCHRPVKCTMELFDLAEAPPFTALSYVWGPTTPVHHIFIDNQPFPVRQNLFNFLRQFCCMSADSEYARPNLWLWTDQISIEQANVDERSHQVQMMSEIYLAADSVIAWLGDGSHPIGPRHYRQTEYDIAKQYKRHRHPGDLAVLLRNKYFGRLWIVQEFLLAERIRVLVRDIWILGNSDDFFDIATRFEHPLPEHAKTLLTARRDPFWSSEPAWEYRLQDVIEKFSEAVSGDSRDKVYGLLGLVRRSEQIQVDYGKVPQQVLMDAILAVFLTDPSLHSLSSREVVWGDSGEGKKELYDLASRMDCTVPQCASLEAMLRAMWTEERLLCFNNHGCPITAMGFEPADLDQTSVDRWWFEFQSERYYVECISPAKVNWFNTKTASLLSEDWHKYLPQDDHQYFSALEL